MAATTFPRSQTAARTAERFGTLAGIMLRYGLVLLIVWFALFKFTYADAQTIQPLISHSPLLSWVYSVTDVNGASRLIGSAELVIAALLAVRPWAPRLSLLGSFGAIGMFLTTLSFLATTPGIWVRVEWIVVPTGPAVLGAFILKDVVLFGAALWTASDSLAAAQAARG